jgi:PAS domain S-box-containing protein
LAMLGYVPGELDLTNMEQWEQLVHPEDLAQTRFPHTEVEYRMRHKDGHWIWVLDTGRVVEHDSLGRPLRMSVVHQDISERKQTEEALKEERNLFVSGSTMVFRWQPGLPWQVEYASPNVQELLGYSPEAFTSGSLSYADIVHPDDISRLVQEHTNHDRQGQTQYEQEYRLQRSDGQILWVHDFSRTVIVNGSRQDHGYVTDITDRKRAEEALRESEEKHRAVVERANEGIVILQDGIVRFTNPSLLAMTGYETGEVEGMEFSRFFPEENWALVLERYRKRMAGEDLSGVFETVLLHKNGKRIPVEMNGGLIQYERKPADLVIMRDISERKQIEGEMEKTRADFLFGVSHELKTPLFLMSISLEMLENSPEAGRAKRTAEFTETWKRNLHRLQHLVFNMVDSQRTQTMGFKLDRQPTDLRALVERVVRENKLLAEPKKVRITADLAPMPPLLIDPEAIHRLVENLLTNAIKFSPRNGEVSLRLAQEKAQAILTVDDRGPGIPTEEQKGLFLPFQRAASTVRSVIPGTGLGLYVAKIIVDAHGGTISMRSKTGQGTTVTVRLPLDTPKDTK